MAVEGHASDSADALNLEVQRDRAIRKLFVWLVSVELVFVVLDWAVNYKGYIDSSELQDLLNIAYEDSLHNYVSSLQYLATAGVLFLVYLHARQTASRSLRFRWGFACAFFLYLAVDDGAAIHETVGTLLEARLASFPSYEWQVVYVPIFGAAALVVLSLGRHLRGRRLRLLVFAGVALWVAAVVLDYLDGRDVYTGLADAWGLGEYTVYHYSRVLEEFVEDLAATLFLVAFLQHLLRSAPRLSFRFR